MNPRIVGIQSARLAGQADSHLTLSQEEALAGFNQAEGLSPGNGDFRHHTLTRGVHLNDLVGVTFGPGTAVVKGLRRCEPCAHLARVANPIIT